jgi:hypothetical protein
MTIKIEEVEKIKQEFETGVAATLVTRPDLTLPQIAEAHNITVRQVRSIAERFGISRKPGRRKAVVNG